MERMLVLAGDAQELTGSMVSPRVAGSSAGAGRTLQEALAIAEADTIVQALGRHGGDRDAAAVDLNISRAYLDARVLALGLT
jgi:transcriptional regulator with PAS, ATPase and Fis domain